MSNIMPFEVQMLPPGSILEQDMKGIGYDIRSFREPFKRVIQQVMAPSIDKNFEVGGRPPWPPLTEETIAIKEGDDRPLIRSGTLRRTAQQLNVWTITPDEAHVSGLPDQAWYGIVHQFGSEFIPARPFMMMQDPEDLDMAEEVFVKWFQERTGEHGFTVEAT